MSSPHPLSRYWHSGLPAALHLGEGSGKRLVLEAFCCSPGPQHWGGAQSPPLAVLRALSPPQHGAGCSTTHRGHTGPGHQLPRGWRVPWATAPARVTRAMGRNGLAGGGRSNAVPSVKRGVGDAMMQWDGDAAGGMSQWRWVGGLRAGAPGALCHSWWREFSTWGFHRLCMRAQKAQCGSLIQLFTGLQSSPRLVPLCASHPSGVAPAGLVPHR